MTSLSVQLKFGLIRSVGSPVVFPSRWVMHVQTQDFNIGFEAELTQQGRQSTEIAPEVVENSRVSCWQVSKVHQNRRRRLMEHTPQEHPVTGMQSSELCLFLSPAQDVRGRACGKWTLSSYGLGLLIKCSRILGSGV